MCTALSRARGVLFLLQSFPLFAYIRTPSRSARLADTIRCLAQALGTGARRLASPSALVGKLAVATEFLLLAAAGTFTRPLSHESISTLTQVISRNGVRYGRKRIVHR